MKAVIDSFVWVRKAELASHMRLEHVRARLTTIPKAFDPVKNTVFDDVPLPQYVEREQYMGLPLMWAWENVINAIPGTQIIDKRALPKGLPVRKTIDPYHPCASPDQPKLVEDLYQEMISNPAVLLQASTGAGKTAISLDFAARVKCKTVVIVRTKDMIRHWRAEAKSLLGLKDSEIGVIQEGKCEAHKPFVIASLATLITGKYDHKVKNSFGYAIWDEAHRLGAREFCKTVVMFNTMYKLAMTATPKRKDEASAVFLDYYGSNGKPTIVSLEPPLPMDFIKIAYGGPTKGKATVTRQRHIANDKRRNWLIARNLQVLYRKGRQVLIPSTRIDHLETLIEMCKEIGIPGEALGLCTAQRTVNGKRVAVPEAEIVRAKTKCQFVFATYNMVEEAFNEPRLDTLFKVMPRGANAQLRGRILRRFPNKEKGLYLILVDEADERFNRYYWDERSICREVGNARVFE